MTKDHIICMRIPARTLLHPFIVFPLQGGLLYYTLKVSIKMYLKQQQYRRQGSRRVLNYDSSMDTETDAT